MLYNPNWGHGPFGLSAPEHAALRQVRYDIEAGDSKVRMALYDECIGGLMAKEMGLDPTEYVFGNSSSLLEDLFYPPFFQLRNWFFTPQQNAVRAIDRFLEGKSPWPWFG